MNKILKDYYSNTNSDSACRFEKGRTLAVEKYIEELSSNTNSDRACRFEKGQDIFSLERDCRTIIQIQIATELVVLKGGGIFSLEIDWRIIIQIQIATAVVFSKKGKTSADRKDIEGLFG